MRFQLPVDVFHEGLADILETRFLRLCIRISEGAQPDCPGIRRELMRLLVGELTEESEAARSSIGDPHGDVLSRGGEFYDEAILQVHGFLLGVPIAHDALAFGHALRVDAQSPWQRNATRNPILTHEAWLTQRKCDAGSYPFTWNMRIVDSGAGRWIALLQAYRWFENISTQGMILPRALDHHFGAVLSEANLALAYLIEANLTGAKLTGANLTGANLSKANLSKAGLCKARLIETNLTEANLTWANLNGAILKAAILVDTDLTGADLTGCHIYGVSAWGLKLERTKQQDLVITREDEPEITVDNIEVAQFVYLLLHNEKIRDVIDTIGKKGVLLLGRFTEGRIQILERLREKLRSLGFVPMVFNFDKPETKGFTETVRLLVNLSHFVIVDITNPRSAPLELQAAVPDYMVPFVPILEKGQDPFSMFVDLQIQYDWVLEPVIGYSSVDRLIEMLEEKIVGPAEAKFNQLLARRTKQLRVEWDQANGHSPRTSA